MSNEIAIRSPEKIPTAVKKQSREPDDKPTAGSDQRERKKAEKSPPKRTASARSASFPGLIALRAVTNARANSIRANSKCILWHHELRPLPEGEGDYRHRQRRGKARAIRRSSKGEGD